MQRTEKVALSKQIPSKLFNVSKSYIPRDLKYVGYTLRALAQKDYLTYFKVQGL